MAVSEVPEVTNYRKIKIVTYSFGDSSSRLGESVRHLVGMPHCNGGEHAVVL